MTNETNDACEMETDEAPATAESGADRWVSATPWWMLSFLGHATVLMMLLFIVAIAEPAPDEQVVVITAPRKAPPEPVVERPKPLEFAKKPLNVEKPTVDPVFVKNRDDETNETNDDQLTHEAKGESIEAKSNVPFRGLGLNDSIGGGGGPSGKFGRPGPGGNADLVEKGGGDPEETEKAVLLALRWLSRHQNDDGSWSMKAHARHCGRVERLAGTNCAPDGVHPTTDAAGAHNFDVGITGLSLLAFLGSGYTHQSKAVVYDGICFGDVVKSGVAYLIRRQGLDGGIGSDDVKEHMYNHAIATLALCEAYGLTGAGKFKGPAEKAIDYLIRGQNPGKGWKYHPQSGMNDSSVTGWAVMALKSADLSGIEFDKTVAYDGARAWLNYATFKAPGDGNTGNSLYKTGYEAPVDAFVCITGVNDQFNDHPAMTAVAVMSRIFMDKKKTAEVHGGAEALLNDLPRWETNAVDYYYWYYASLALYQFDGPKGRSWRAWEAKMVDALVNHQNLEGSGDKEGSWEPVDRWSCRGGRVYATAINALTLEVYYRYTSVFGGKTE